jgi:1,4-dihydroxy-2-naphthoyl-CoA synthase
LTLVTVPIGSYYSEQSVHFTDQQRREKRMPKVIYEVRDRIAYITLNRPEARNAIDEEMARRCGVRSRDSAMTIRWMSRS